MTHPQPIRIGILGAGLIGAFHARIVAADPDCVLVGIADPDRPAAERAAPDGVAVFDDHQALLADARPDGVIVAVPNALHTPVALDCASAGVAMLVEKPIADSLAAGRALVAATEAAGVVVATGHHRRFDPAAERARSLIDDGALGRVLAIQCLWAARKPDDYYDAAGGWRKRAPGGGVTLINLIHEVDMMRFLCGEVTRVYAEAGSTARGFEVEDTVAVTLRFANGVLGTITASDATPSPWTWEQATGENPRMPSSTENSYRIVGTEGALGYPQLALWKHDAPDRCWWDPIAASEQPVGERAAIAAQLRDFCAAIRGERTARVSAVEGLRTLEVTEAILESAASGQPVVLSGT